MARRLWSTIPEEQLLGPVLKFCFNLFESYGLDFYPSSSNLGDVHLFYVLVIQATGDRIYKSHYDVVVVICNVVVQYMYSGSLDVICDALVNMQEIHL